MALKVAFQMEPLSHVKPRSNSSLVLIKEAQRRGYEVYQFGPNEVTLSPGRVFARARKINVKDGIENFYTQGKDELIDLLSFDVIMMRNNPPFDMEYITATYMLESVERHILVVNHPTSVRNAPEKLFPFVFGKYMPLTIITEDINAVRAMMHKEGHIVIKPLYMFGGHDVFAIKTDNELNKQFPKLLKKYKAPVVAQKYLPEVKNGDKRIMFIDGEVQGAFLRVPKKGSIRANLRAGGKMMPSKLTAYEKKMCDEIGEVLKQKGLMIAGIDVVGEYLTEINVTSPAGILEIRELYSKDISKILWDKIEKMVK